MLRSAMSASTNLDPVADRVQVGGVGGEPEVVERHYLGTGNVAEQIVHEVGAMKPTDPVTR